MNVGSYTLDLLLDNKQFGGGLKSSLNMLKSFNGQARNLIKLKPVKPDFGKINAELKKTEASLRKHKANANSAAVGQEKLNASMRKGSTVSVKYQSALQNTGQRVMGVRAAVETLASTFGNLISAYDSQQVASDKLLNNLRNVGEGMESFIRLNNLAAELQGITVYPDEQITDAMSQLGTFQKTSEEIAILIPRVLDLAAAFDDSGEGGRSLIDIATMVGKVNEDTIGALRRVGVEFTKEQAAKLKSTKGTEQAIILAQVLDQNYQGLAVSIGKTEKGLRRIAKNQLGDFKEQLGQLLSQGILPLLSPLREFISVLQSAPQHVKEAVIVLTALAVTFVLVGTSIGGMPYILGLIFGVMLALPEPVRMVAGAIMVLVGALIAFNVVSGGIPLMLGLIASGLAAIFSATDIFGSSVEDVTDKLEESNKELDEHRSRIEDLKTVYDANSKATVLTKKEQDNYNDALEKTKGIFPGVVSGIDAKTKSELINADGLKDLIAKEEALLKVKEDAQSTILANQLRDQIELYNEQGESIQELNEKLADNGKEVRETFDSWGDWRDLGTGFIYDINDALDETSQELLDTSKASEETADKFNEIFATGLKLNNLPPVLKQIQIETIGNVEATEKFRAALASLDSTAIQSYLNIADIVGKSAKLQALWATGMQLMKNGAVDVGTALLKNVQSIAENLRGTLGTKKDTGSTTTTGKSGTTKQIERDLDRIQKLREEIAQAEKELANIESKYGQTNVYVEQKEKLEKLREELVRLLSLPVSWNLDDINALVQEELEKIPKHTLKINTQVAFKTPEQLLAEQEAQRQEIINSEEYQAANFMLSELANTLKSGLSDAWTSTFGEANSLGEKLIQSLVTKMAERLISNTFASILSSLFPGLGSFGSLFSGLFGGGGAGRGYATGGVIPGFGSGDIVPIMAEPGEGVLSRKGMRGLGVAALNAFNAGRLPSLVQRFASGGLVQSRATASAQTIKVELGEGRLEGRTIRYALQRVDDIEKERIG